MSVADWSDLPADILETVATKLTIYIDYIRFRAVCTNWRSNLPSTPQHLPCQIPWLMIPHTQTRGNFRGFFSLTEGKVHTFNLPETRRRRCCGSSKGWLVLVEQETPLILLLNPITRAQFQLPPVTSFPNVLGFDVYKMGREYLIGRNDGGTYTKNLKHMCEVFIKKVVLSSSPRDDYVAVAILSETGELGFCRRGESVWRMIDGAQYYSEDVIFHNGLLYAVNKKGRIAVCDVIGGGDSPVVTMIEPPETSGGDILYLVDSGKELLLVARYLIFVSDAEANTYYRTERFRVFKLEVMEVRWVEVECLGDRMLFVGGNSSVCLMASGFRGCQRNCIYFTDEYTEANEDGVRGDHDVGVSNLGDGSIDLLPCYTGDLQLRWPPHVWVTANPG